MERWDTDLQKFFPNIGFNSLKKDQEKVLTCLMDNGNTLGLLQTGAGKSLIYWMAALELNGIAIVISPLIALIDEQAEKLKKHGYEVLKLHAGIPADKQIKIIKSFAKKEINPNFIFLSPEKIATDGLLVQAIKRRKEDIKLLVIDEVHCVSQWGMSFRPFYKRIPDFLNTIFDDYTKWCRILALTATVNNQELKDICSYFHIDTKNIIRQQLMMRGEIQLHTKKCVNEDEKETELWKILNIHRGEKILVYVYRKYTNHGVEGLCKKAEDNGYKCSAFHGDMTAQERQDIINKFKNNEINIIFATNAFGMGIDIPDIRVVIHYMIPESAENYYQEIGRAARDGKGANAYLLYSDKNIDVRSDYYIDHSFPSEKNLRESFEYLIPFFKKPGYNSFHAFENEDVLKCFPYYVEAGLIEICAKGFGDTSKIKDIQSQTLKEYISCANNFLAIVNKKNIEPNVLANLVYNDYLDDKLTLQKALDKTLIIKVNEIEISEKKMKIMLDSIEEKKIYKNTLLALFAKYIENSKQSIELHQEIAQYLGTDKHQLKRIYKAKDGTMVRSKSEVIICDLLCDSNIEYEYEKKLKYDGEKYIEPDFTITLPNKKEIYWEHVGMLGLETYDERWAFKLDVYEKYYPNQMVKTYESAVLSNDAEEMINHIKDLIQSSTI